MARITLRLTDFRDDEDGESAFNKVLDALEIPEDERDYLEGVTLSVDDFETE